MVYVWISLSCVTVLDTVCPSCNLQVKYVWITKTMSQSHDSFHGPFHADQVVNTASTKFACVLVDMNIGFRLCGSLNVNLVLHTSNVISCAHSLWRSMFVGSSKEYISVRHGVCMDRFVFNFLRVHCSMQFVRLQPARPMCMNHKIFYQFGWLMPAFLPSEWATRFPRSLHARALDIGFQLSGSLDVNLVLHTTMWCLTLFFGAAHNNVMSSFLCWSFGVLYKKEYISFAMAHDGSLSHMWLASHVQSTGSSQLYNSHRPIWCTYRQLSYSHSPCSSLRRPERLSQNGHLVSWCACEFYPRGSLQVTSSRGHVGRLVHRSTAVNPETPLSAIRWDFTVQAPHAKVP